jgi:hypothetical protein
MRFRVREQVNLVQYGEGWHSIMTEIYEVKETLRMIHRCAKV